MSKQFLADVKSAVSQAVHQCNNHLSIILSSCELALAVEDPQTVKKKIESCVLRITQLTDLLSQLNRFATINTEIKPAALQRVFEVPLKQIEARANARQVECSTHLAVDGLLPVPGQVLHLLMELLGTNAIHSAQNGALKKIQVSVNQNENEIAILASNSGRGPESMMDKTLYGNFFTDTAQPAQDSLAAVKSLTRLLGGQILYKINNGMNEIHIKLPLKFNIDF